MRITRQDVMLLLVVLIWGGSFGFVKFAQQEIDPLAFAVARLLLGAPAMLAILWVRERRLPVRPAALSRADLLVFGGLSLFLAGDYILFSIGLAYTSSAKASIFYSACPIIVALLSAARGRRVTATAAGGLALAVVGVTFVILAGTGGIDRLAGIGAGDLVVFTGVVSWAFFTYYSSHVLDRYSPIRVSAYAMVGAAVMCFGLCFRVVFSQQWLGLSWAAWSGLVYAAGLSTVLCIVIWYDAVSRLGPLKVITFQYLVPVTATVLAFMVWKEALYPLQIAGGVLVLAGVQVVRRSQ